MNQRQKQQHKFIINIMQKLKKKEKKMHISIIILFSLSYCSN